MKLISNLFKERVKWSVEELSSLLSVLTFQAGVDGNIDDQEKMLILQTIEKLPGEKPDDWDAFFKKTQAKDGARHMAILKNMHSDKKDLVITHLYNVSDADGNTDKNEKKIISQIAKTLNVNIPMALELDVLRKSKKKSNSDNELKKLEDNLESLKPPIATAEFWINILNSRAESRKMFKDSFGQTFHDSASGHREEYILKYDNDQMTIEDIYNRIDVYHLFVSEYEKFFQIYQKLNKIIPEEIENRFFALIESLAGAELTLLTIKQNDNTEIDEDKIFKIIERPNNEVVEDDENEENKDVVDKDMFTYYKGYLFNGTLIINYKDGSKQEFTMRFGLKHGTYKKYNKSGKIIETKTTFNDMIC
jgi:tellurite resistance protein